MRRDTFFLAGLLAVFVAAIGLMMFAHAPLVIAQQQPTNTPQQRYTNTPTPGGGGEPQQPQPERNGQICVSAFLDVNNDGAKDPGEPLLAGGFANIKNLSTSAITIADFLSSGPNCHFLPGGMDYFVNEGAAPPGYALDPSTWSGTLSAGGVVDLKFRHTSGGQPCVSSTTAGVAGVPTCTPTPTLAQPCVSSITAGVAGVPTCTPTPTPTQPCVSSITAGVAGVPTCTPTRPPSRTPTPTETPCISVANLANALVPQRCTQTPTPTPTSTETPCVNAAGVRCTRTPTFTPTNTPPSRTHTKTPTGTITPPTRTPTFTPTPTSIARLTLTPPVGLAITGKLPLICGDWLAFHTNRDNNGKNWEVYRLDGVEGASGAKLYDLSQHSADDFTPSRSPDDKWVAFQSFRDGHGEIYITDNEGKKRVRLTTTVAGSSIRPMFSPDNRHIVFQSNRAGDWNLYLLDIGTTPLDPADDTLTQLTNSASAEVNPSWAPDGQWLTFESDFDGKWNVYIMNVLTFIEYRLTNGPEENRDPAWSPNGKWIAFRSLVKGNWVLYTIQPNGKSLTQITQNSMSAYQQAWSHDSTRLAYQSPRKENGHDNYDVYVIEVTTRKELRLTTDPAIDISPSWDCTDAHIAFTSTRTGNPDVFSVPSGGGSQSALTTNEYNDQWPEWTPLYELASRQQ